MSGKFHQEQVCLLGILSTCCVQRLRASYEIHSEIMSSRISRIHQILQWREQTKREKQEKRSAHYEKNRRENYSKCSRSTKEKSRSQEQTWMVFKKQKCPYQRGQVENLITFLQGRFLLSENINNWTYTLDKKVPAVFPRTSKGKEWPIISSSFGWTWTNVDISSTFCIKHVK